MRNYWKIFGFTALLGLSLTQKAPAPPLTTSTYTFTGTCMDCAGTGTASLVLANYTLGQAITSSNLVSFTYNGTNLISAFTITPSSPNFNVSGSITNYPGQNNFTISSSAGQNTGFFSSTNGQWGVGLADFGSVSIWGAVTPATPVPSTSLLFIVGLIAVGTLVWRKRQTA